MSKDARVRDANGLIATGLGLGVYGAASLALAGAVCPVCVVAAPALLGAGLWQRWRARTIAPGTEAPAAEGEPERRGES